MVERVFQHPAKLMYDKPVFIPAGDQALVVELGDTISPETNRRVNDLLLAIEEHSMLAVIDLIPTYRSLLVQYDPMLVSFDDLQERLSNLEGSLDQGEQERPSVVHIPTIYGGEYGPDLEFVAEHAGTTTDEAVSLHSGIDYLVYMIGFTPGFPYLGGLPERLATPRLETPRPSIPAGSVGIAESQTGVYPMSSPGGWRLIGRTPLRLFDPSRQPPSILSAGDYVRFVPVASEDEYSSVQGLVEAGDYKVTTSALP